MRLYNSGTEERGRIRIVCLLLVFARQLPEDLEDRPF